MTGLGIEIIPGGAFEILTHMRYEDEPGRYHRAVLDLLREHAPSTFAWVDMDAFGLTRPLDHLRGAITPTVRQGYVRLKHGKFAVARSKPQAT